jgi:hypothetical protein
VDFTARHRNVLRIVVVALFAGTLVVPVLIVATSRLTTPASLVALRLLALYAYTLIFWNILIGSSTTLFYRLFKPLNAYRFHIASGVTGFLLAVAHMGLVLGTLALGAYSKAWIIGPAVLLLLAVTIFSALDKRALPRV